MDVGLFEWGFPNRSVRHSLVLNNEVGQQAFDVPDRVLLWGGA